jgi:hypothetical protein
MPKSISRFLINEADYIIDTEDRFPPTPVCQCGCRATEIESELDNQIYLRRTVLRSQLSQLSEKMESLNEPEAHSLAEVFYWTIFVSRLDWTIGQASVIPNRNDSSNQPVAETADPPILSFLLEVEQLLRDLYSDCDQDLLNDGLESIRTIALQWEHARTALPRGFLTRLSRQVNATARSQDAALLATPAVTASQF